MCVGRDATRVAVKTSHQSSACRTAIKRSSRGNGATMTVAYNGRLSLSRRPTHDDRRPYKALRGARITFNSGRRFVALMTFSRLSTCRLLQPQTLLFLSAQAIMGVSCLKTGAESSDRRPQGVNMIGVAIFESMYGSDKLLSGAFMEIFEKPSHSQSCMLFCPNSYPRESEGICFHWRWFVCVCVCLSVCLSVTTITKKMWTDLHQICEGS